MKATGILSNAFFQTYERVQNLAQAVALTVGSAVRGPPSDPIPKDWDEKARKASEYYRTIGSVKKAVVTWRALAMGDGITVTAESDPDRKALKKFNRQIGLDQSCRDIFRTALVRGEAIGFKSRDENGKIKRIRSINPSSCEAKWDKGELSELVQYAVDANGKIDKAKKAGTWTGDTLKRDIFYLKLDASEWERGESIILPAFELVQILNDYRRADRATAKRWASVLRFIRIGGVVGNRYILPTPKDLKDAKTQLDKLIPGEGLVTPPYWEAKDAGTEGKVLDTTERIKLLNEEIAIAILLFPVFLSGNASSFATARSLLKVLRFQIIEFTSVLRDLLDWIFSPEELVLLGIGEEAEIDYIFSGVDVSTEEWEYRLCLELYRRGALSRRTIQLRFGHDPEIENANIEKQPIVIDKAWTAQDAIGMVGTKTLTAETIVELLGLDKKAAAQEEPEAQPIQAAATAKPRRRQNR